MNYYVGLDVAMEETAICIVDDERRIVREGKAASEPEAIAAFLIATGLTLERSASRRGPLAPGRATAWPRRPAGDLHRRPAHEGGGQRHAGQDRPDRRPQHRVRDAGGGTDRCT